MLSKCAFVCVVQRYSLLFLPLSYFSVHAECDLTVYPLMQAMHAQSSVAVGLKGATKAMASMNNVCTLYRLNT